MLKAPQTQFLIEKYDWKQPSFATDKLGEPLLPETPLIHTVKLLLQLNEEASTLIPLNPVPITMKIALLKRFIQQKLQSTAKSSEIETSSDKKDIHSLYLVSCRTGRKELLQDFKQLAIYDPQDGDCIQLN